MARSPLLCSFFVVLTALFAQEHAMAQTIHYVDNLSRCEGRAPCYATIMEAVDAAVASIPSRSSLASTRRPSSFLRETAST